MNTKKIAAIFSALMLTLVISGVAYAHWTDSLIIEGTVYTGNIDVGLSADVWLDLENDKTNLGYKEVATAHVEVLDPLSYGPVKHVKITIENAYPCLDAIVVFDMENYGSVPVALVNYERFPGESDEWRLDWDRAIEQLGEGWYSDNYPGASPCQLDPLDWDSSNTWYWWWHLHVTNSAEEGETVYFYATVEFWNWNEAPPEALCNLLPSENDIRDIAGYGVGFYHAGGVGSYYYPPI